MDPANGGGVIPRALARAIRAAGGPLEAGSRERTVEGCDAIVILGATLRPGGTVGPVLDERIRAGVALWRRGVAPLVCVTGGGRPGRVEADAMAERARDLGVPRDALRVERRARTTDENAWRCAALLQPEGVRRVCLVSQPFHLRRALRLFRRAGFDPVAERIDGGLQDRHPALAARWIAREYAAWLKLLARGR